MSLRWRKRITKEKRSRDMIPLKDEDANGQVVAQATSTLGVADNPHSNEKSQKLPQLTDGVRSCIPQLDPGSWW